jgi:hypothetical protein
VTWGVNQVEYVINAVISLERQANCLAFDCDATLAFNIHTIEILGSHVSAVDYPSDLQHSVGQCGFAVVDVGNDAEIANEFGWGGTR